MRDRYLIVADPLDTLDPTFDLGVCVSKELIRRGIPVDYLDLLATDPGQPVERFLGTLPVREIRGSDQGAKPFWDLGPERSAAVEEYRVILQRKDPPVDKVYIRHHRPFEQAPRDIIQVNRPPATYRFSEHTLHLRYPEWAAPTVVCHSLEEVEAAVRAQELEAVLKPVNTYCGIGVTFLAPDAPRDEIADFWERWQPEVTVQPFLPAVRESGDLRILVLNGKVLGAVLRVPQEGSLLANLHQGASPARFDPSERQLEACRFMGADLAPLGLHLIGFDFIGEHLTEINITSPTLIVQINQVNGIRADVDLVDELERMWSERVTAPGR